MIYFTFCCPSESGSAKDYVRRTSHLDISSGNVEHGLPWSSQSVVKHPSECADTDDYKTPAIDDFDYIKFFDEGCESAESRWSGRDFSRPVNFVYGHLLNESVSVTGSSSSSALPRDPVQTGSISVPPVETLNDEDAFLSCEPSFDSDEDVLGLAWSLGSSFSDRILAAPIWRSGRGVGIEG